MKNVLRTGECRPARIADSPSDRVSAATYAHLPLAFEENQGQTDPAIRFLAHGARFSRITVVAYNASYLSPYSPWVCGPAM